jgi:hypothetical protein
VDNKHALLSPSSSQRWLNCPPSARMGEHIEDTTSIFAEEGTDAHTLSEYKINKALGLVVENPKANLKYYDEAMDDHTDGYAIYILELYEMAKSKNKDALILTEQQLDISKFVPDCKGTGDCIILADKTLHVIDFKYGQGVLVSSENNTQMMLYALGALEMFSSLYEIDQVLITVYQPRLSNISTHTIETTELLNWAENYLKPQALLAHEGKGEFQSGEHCRFCKVKATCRKRAKDNLELAKYDFRSPPLLHNNEIGEILKKAEELVAWASDIKEYAFSLLNRGQKLEGFKLVRGRSNRKYIDDEAVAKIVKNAGYDPYDNKILGITAMTSLLGKNQFQELLGSLIHKPLGAPTLVPESDKRPAITINDFNGMEEK